MLMLRILDPNITILGLLIIRYHHFISAFCWIRSPVIKVIFAVFVLLRKEDDDADVTYPGPK